MIREYTVNYYECSEEGEWFWRDVRVRAYTPFEAEREVERALRAVPVSFRMIGYEAA